MADTPAPIDPDRILEHTFTAVRRGYDPLEVQRYLLQIANQLRSGRDREADLRRQLEESEKRTAPIDDLDPAQLARLLGEETARVLEAAQGAAAEIKSKAEENVARLLREARDESQQMREDAETVLSRKTAEAEEVAAAIRADADGVLESARSEASGLVEAGRQEGREMVGEAQKVRQRMLDDLSRRRKLLRQQIEQLQAGRDRLLAAYDVVRETLDVATEELHIALPEAKLAAETASLKEADADDADSFDAEVDEAVAAEAADAASKPGPAGGTEAGPGPDAREPVAEPEVATGGGTKADDEADDTALGADEAVEAGGEDPDSLAPDPVEGRHSSSVTIVRSGGAATNPATATATATADADPEAEPDEDGESPAVAPTAAADVEEDTADVDEGTADVDDDVETAIAEVAATADAPDTADDAAADASDAGPAASTDKATSVFARLRQEEVVVVDEGAGEVLEIEVVEAALETVDAALAADEEADTPAADSDDEADDEVEGPVDAAAELVQRRDAAISDLERNLARRIKRELSDEQNELLASLAAAKGTPEASDVLPAPEDHVERYQAIALPTLAAAATAGADLVSTVAGPPAAPTSVADLATELAAEMVAPLRERLERAFSDSDGHADDIAQSIRSSYREWKGQRVDQVASHAVVAACNRGLLDRLPEGTMVRWVLADGDNPSPDCDDNSLAGEVVRGEPFPTGHTAPPLHATCRCMVVPVEY